MDDWRFRCFIVISLICLILKNVHYFYLRLSGSSPFLQENDDETTKTNISFCRFNFDEFYNDVTGESVLFIQQCLKRSP